MHYKNHVFLSKGSQDSEYSALQKVPGDSKTGNFLGNDHRHPSFGGFSV